MDNQTDRWPRLQEYQAAIIKAEGNFKDEQLRGFRVQRHPNLTWDAWPRAGSFGAVFKAEDVAIAYALKVFYYPQQDRQLRYRLIDEHLRTIPMPRRLVTFAYDEAGIRVSERDYPLLRMDWAYGDALDTFLDRHFSSAASIDNGMLCAEWVATMAELNRSAVAHGDLQHKNILVQADRTFRLVDYDGMFVPRMRQLGLTACETGVSGYQHPERGNGKSRFDEKIDDFSALVIMLTLACVDADLWGRYHEDGRLLLGEEDICRSDESALLAELAERKGMVSTLANLVRAAAMQDINLVPSFGSVVHELGMQWPGAPDAAAAGARPLTYTQRQVAGLRAAGKNVEEIASALGLFPATVLEYVKALEHEPEREEAAPPAAGMSPSAPPAAQRPGQQRTLSPRQQQVLDLLRAGLRPEQIAVQLNLQPSTVNRHLSSIRTVVGEGEVRKLLGQAASGPSRTAAAQSAKPAQPAQKLPAQKPVAASTQPPRPVTPRSPSAPAARVTNAPRRTGTSTGGVGAILALIFIIIAVVAILAAVVH